MANLGDDFGRADNTDLNAANTGKTLNGSAGTWSWTEVANDSQISSNTLKNVTSGSDCYVRVEQDLDSVNHIVQANVSNAGSATTTSTWLIARFAAVATTGYGFRIRQADCFLYSIVAGVQTQIGTAATGATSAVLCKLSVNGSAIECFINGVSVISVADTTIVTGVRVGGLMRGGASARSTIDNFYAEDIVASGKVMTPNLMDGMGSFYRSMN